MKNKYIISLLVLFSLVIFIRCESNNKQIPTNLEMGALDLSDLKLNINFGFGEEKLLEKQNFKRFIDSNFDEIAKMDKDLIFLFKIKNGKTFYSINNMESLIKIASKEKGIALQKVHSSGFYNETATCTTCSGKSCIEKALVDTAGDEKEQVFFAMTPRKVGFVQKGVRVCYASNINAIVDALD
ncbi:hypothetical protein [uncultured Polaribacter sp.]|uniref:hypothetical protein n=1 Tax=uncultured Polaribacter sp. TaxID=174711 RepID=UPI00261B409F|nr:hypothetical protein [uncultured Polaribacter sp.]